LYEFRVVEAAISSDDEESTFGAFGNRKKDGGDESFTVVRLLKDLDLLAKTGAGPPSIC
jgi:hypothetical protein